MKFGGGSQHYCTPQPLLEPVYDMGPIALDPCSNPNSIVVCQKQVWYHLEDWSCYTDHEGVIFGDGLAMSWPTDLVFVNPPFSDVLTWLQKAHQESLSGSEVIMLLNGDTSTAWFQDFVWPNADRFGFFKGRKKFIGAKHTNPWPHLYVYFGHRGDEFEEKFSKYGRVI